MNTRLLHTTIFSVGLVLLLSACGFFFSNEDLGQHGQLTLYLGESDSSRAVYDPPVKLPTFSAVTISINGKTVSYTRGSNNSYNVPIPEEKNYTVDIKAVVNHSGNDSFPFIKSLEGSAEGPFKNNAAAIPLSLRETEVVLLGQPSGGQSVLFSYADPADGTPINVTNLGIQINNSISPFDFDPYGNLFIWNHVNDKFQLTKVNKDKNEAVTDIIENRPYGIGYDRKGGRVYYTTKVWVVVTDVLTLYSVDSTGTKQQQWTDSEGVFGYFSDQQFVSTHNDGNDTFIYVGVDTGNLSTLFATNIPTILKFKQENNNVTFIGSAAVGSNAHIRDLKVIDDTVYVIIGSDNDSNILALDVNAPIVNEVINISNAKVLQAAAGTYHFQRIVGWDDDAIHVFEWRAPDIRRITKLQRGGELATIGTSINLDDTIYWRQ
ncbi:hypothetical protein LQZ19_12560 [Treponema primitia]|uniref:hypothetical protein n=1 Tax=Treponema primitia TaxID=88058 RepID=UPI003980523E